MLGVGASARAFVARGFTYIEDVVYVGLGVLLAGAAVVLLAGIRRVLVLTAEFADLLERGEQAFTNAMIELGLLTAMILILVVSLMLLRRRGSQPVAEKG